MVGVFEAAARFGQRFGRFLDNIGVAERATRAAERMRPAAQNAYEHTSEFVSDAASRARTSLRTAKEGEAAMRSASEAIEKAGFADKYMPRLAKNAGGEDMLVLVDKANPKTPIVGEEFYKAAQEISKANPELESKLVNTSHAMFENPTLKGVKLDVPISLSTSAKAGMNVLKAKGVDGKGGPLSAVHSMMKEGTNVYKVADGATDVVQSTKGARAWGRGAFRAVAAAPVAVGAGTAATTTLGDMAQGEGLVAAGLDGAITGAAATLGTAGQEASGLASIALPSLFGTRASDAMGAISGGTGGAAQAATNPISNFLNGLPFGAGEGLQKIMNLVGQNSNFTLLVGGLAASMFGSGIVKGIGKACMAAGLLDTLAVGLSGKHIHEMVGDFLTGNMVTSAGKDAVANIDSQAGVETADAQTDAATRQLQAKTVGEARESGEIKSSESEAPVVSNAVPQFA